MALTAWEDELRSIRSMINGMPDRVPTRHEVRAIFDHLFGEDPRRKDQP